MPQFTSSDTSPSNGQDMNTAQPSGDNVSEHPSHITEEVTLEAYRKEAARMIKERPLTSVMALFGVGLGAGVAVGCLLSRSSSPSRSSMADEIGQSIIASLSKVVPESLGGKP